MKQRDFKHSKIISLEGMSEHFSIQIYSTEITEKHKYKYHDLITQISLYLADIYFKATNLNINHFFAIKTKS